MPKLPMDQYKKRTRGRPTKYDLPDYIPDTPQNVAAAILRTPPKRLCSKKAVCSNNPDSVPKVAQQTDFWSKATRTAIGRLTHLQGVPRDARGTCNDPS